MWSDLHADIAEEFSALEVVDPVIFRGGFSFVDLDQKRADRAEQSAAWRAANPERVKTYTAAWRAENPEKTKAYRAAHRAKNPEKVKAQRAASTARKRLDPVWAASERAKRRAYMAKRKAKLRCS